MELKYFGKRGEHEIYDAIEMPALGWRKRHINWNVLFQSDNLSALKYLIEECDMAGRVDLVYIDPPFATNADFTFSESRSSTISRASWGNLAYSDKLKGADFLEFLRERLLLIRRLMSKRGSIYLHIDYKIWHYVKVLMDEVFGIENFKNDITRIKCNPKNFHRSA